jgi:type IV pilus assembly protein PilX
MTRSLEPSPSTIGPRRSRQRGVALMVVLILLVLMTLLALVSLRGTLMQERMSSSQYDRSLGFQAAEAALREAEAAAAKKPAVPGANCNAAGICATPIATDTPRWLLDEASWGAISKPVDDVVAGSLAIKPSYIIEYMGRFDSPFCTTAGDPDSACDFKENHYRITVRSHDPDRADVTLQTNYAVP